VRVKMIKLTIPGEPVGKARARVCRHGTYTPKKTKDYELLIMDTFMQSNYKNGIYQSPLEGPLSMTVNAYFQVPKSASNYRRKKMMLGEIRPTKKPDADNVLKSVADALNKLAYNDDSQIVRVKVEKWYSEVPRVEVEIWEVEK